MRFSPVVLGAVALPLVFTQSRAQEVRVRTVEPVTITRPVRARAITGVMRLMDDSTGARAVLGLTTSSGGPRDTLGLLVTSIVSGSPAEQAGLLEGNRLVSINGVSLALSPADADTPEMRGLMGRRLQREMRKVKPGDAVHLRVYADGRTKSVDVKADSASTVYGRAGGRFFFDDGERRAVPALPSRPAVPVRPRARSVPALPPRAPRASRAPDCCDADRVIIMRERQRAAADRARDAAERMLERSRRANRERLRAMDFDIDRGGRGVGVSGRVSVNSRGDSLIVHGFGDSYALRMSGLQLTPVSSDLASYFGDGSEHGLLVLNAESWLGVQAGDVILSVNGKPVREDDAWNIALARSADNKVELLRKGKKMTVTMKREEQ